jgi:signal transduction histidine kinase
MTGRRSDLVLAAVWLAVSEAEIILDIAGDRGHSHWPLPADVLLVALMTLPAAWRRVAPVLSACLTVIAFSTLATWGTADVVNIYAPLLAMFLPAYSMAAYARRGRAVAGLAVTEAVFVVALIGSAAPAPAWVLVLGAAGASWLVGRAVRDRRRLSAELRAARQRVADGLQARERLAVAEQRAQIAAELQVLVAHCLGDMIAQTKAIESLLDDEPTGLDQRPLVERPLDLGPLDLGPLDASMATVEETGRQALVEMRRILGVLRHPDQKAVLTPASRSPR